MCVCVCACIRVTYAQRRRYIDDISFGTIRELIMLNNIEIIGHIQSDTRSCRSSRVCSKDAVVRREQRAMVAHRLQYRHRRRH